MAVRESLIVSKKTKQNAKSLFSETTQGEWEYRSVHYGETGEQKVAWKNVGLQIERLASLQRTGMII